MKKLLIFTSLLEAGLGILLMLFPFLIVELVFGIEDNDAINLVGHFTGIGFFSFGLACFPFKKTDNISTVIAPVRGMFAYNFIVCIFFGYLVIEGAVHGILLLPAFILHTLLTIIFIVLFLKKKRKISDGLFLTSV